MTSVADPRLAGLSEAIGCRDIIVVGASAGGVESLMAFVRALEPDLPAAILVVLHVPASGASALPPILERAGTLPVDVAVSTQELRHGRIVIAPPDRHLVVVNKRTLEEKAGLSLQLAERAASRGSVWSHERFTEQAYEATRSAPLVRWLLESPTTDAPGVEADPGIESAHHG